jgi:arylamine N-acetyltransferase
MYVQPNAMTPHLSNSETARYLSILELETKEPDLLFLNDIVKSHLWHIPFENISKLYRWKIDRFRGVVDVHTFLDGIEKLHCGGTCYSNNFHLHQLLRTLRFDVKLCGADMSHPDVHLVNVVRIEETDYLVDCGYGAPLSPTLPMNLQTICSRELGEDRYDLLPNEGNGRSRLIHRKNGEVHHGYVVNPRPRSLAEFESIIADSFRPEATFMNALMIAKFSPERSVVIRNAVVFEYSGNEVKRSTARSTDELVDAIVHHFSIPAEVVVKAITDLPLPDD